MRAPLYILFWSSTVFTGVPGEPHLEKLSPFLLVGNKHGKEEHETEECQGHEEERKFVESWRYGLIVWRTSHGIHTTPCAEATWVLVNKGY